MKLIQLHNASNTGRILISIKHVVAISGLVHEGNHYATNIALTSGYIQQVTETPEEVVDAIAALTKVTVSQQATP